VRLSTDSDSSGLGDLGLLEREAELRTLGESLAGSRGGDGGVLLIQGAAGVGKTVLLDALAGLARGAGCEVLRARGSAFEQPMGFTVVRQLFEQRILGAPASEREALLGGAAGLAAPVLGVAGQARPATAEPEFAARHGLYWLTCNLSDRRPLTLIVDDAHWCDQATLGWLLYLARRLEGLPVLVALGVRVGDGIQPGSLAELEAEPNATVLRPAPFSLAATASVLESVYERPVADAFAAACHGWTGGNPFLVCELAAELRGTAIAPSAQSVEQMRSLNPASVRRSVLPRLARLGPDAIAVGRALAVFGVASALHQVAALAEIPLDRARQAADALISARILEPDTPLRFAHPIIAATVYDDAPPARRAADHLRAARLLAAAGAGVEQVCVQLLRGEPAADAWVVDQLRAAAAEQLSRGAPDAAASLLDRAIGEPPPPSERVHVLQDLGLALDLKGESDRAADQLRRALAGTRRPELRLVLTGALSRALAHAARFEEACDVIRAEIERAADSESLRALQIQLALLSQFAPGDAWRAAHALLEQLEPSLSAATPDGRAALVALAVRRGHLAEAAERAITPARATLASPAPIDPASESVAIGSAISVLMYCDALDDAESALARWRGRWQDAGSRFGVAQAWYLHGRVDRTRGRLVEAIANAELAVATMDESGDTWTRALCVALLVDALTEQGKLDAAGDWLERHDLTREVPGDPIFAILLESRGRWRAARGDLDGAAADLTASGELHLAWGSVSPAFSAWRSALAVVRLRRGERDEAARLVLEELELARRVGLPRPIGVSLWAHGLMTGGETGIEVLSEAVRELERSPARIEHGRALIDLGAALRRAGRRREARAALRDGVELARACGAEASVERAQLELRAAGGRPRAPLRTGADALTASELRVCKLAAAGASNPEIAQQLYVTRATVESHLRSAYGKLGIASRQQLAAALSTAQP
jgi:DNA-binding CsgD family transcriptional regulator